MVNYGNVASIGITATPDFHPPYTNTIAETIENADSLKCNMFIEFDLSEGFDFLPMAGNLPSNVTPVGEYEYKNVMKAYIKDVLPNEPVTLNLPVYTLSPNKYARTENVSCRVLYREY